MDTSNVSAVLIPSGAFTTTQEIDDIENRYHSAVDIVLDMTTVGTGSVTVSIDGKDIASGKWYNLLTGAAITTNSTNVYSVGPSLTAATNAVANKYVPRLFRVKVTANNANSATYSLSYNLIG